MIPHEFISEVIARTDIVEVLREHHIELKQAGRGEFKACCPFHGEKTPSFYVSSDKQVYNCFGCKAKGNVVKFIQEYDKLSFVDAIETLAERLNMPVPHQSNGQNQENNSEFSLKELYNTMLLCSQLYHQVLMSPQGAIAMEYLSNRGITQDTIKRFNIGFAPDQWNFLSSNLKNYNPKLNKMLLELGMLRQNQEQRTFDMFRNRIMIPIIDRRGRVIAFGGRVMNNDQPKYMNSPEMAIYHKGNELFGLHQAIQWHQENRQDIQQIVIVEGYMDVIALSQFGINYAVASLGTATTRDQLQLVLRNTKRLIFCYDGDAAGQKAAWHALTIILGILDDAADVKFAFLPSEHDPDSYVRAYGKEGYEEYLNQALELEDYFFKYIKEHQVNPGNKNELAQIALEHMATMPDNIRLENMISMLSPRTNIDAEKLMTLLKRQRSYSNRRNPTPIEQQVPSLEMTPMRRLLILAIQYPMCIQTHTKSIVKLLNQIIDLNPNLRGLSVFNGLVSFILQHEQGKVSAASIVEAYAATDLGKWMKVLSEQELYARAKNVDLENVYKDLASTMTRMLVDYHQAKVNDLLATGQSRELTPQELTELTEHQRFVKNNYGRPYIEDKN